MVSTPLKNISQNGNLPQIGLKIKHIWNHHVVFCPPNTSRVVPIVHIPCYLHSYPLSRCSRINIIKGYHFYSQLQVQVFPATKSRRWACVLFCNHGAPQLQYQHPVVEHVWCLQSWCLQTMHIRSNSSRLVSNLVKTYVSSQIIYFIYSYQASSSECSPIDIHNPQTRLPPCLEDHPRTCKCLGLPPFVGNFGRLEGKQNPLSAA